MGLNWYEGYRRMTLVMSVGFAITWIFLCVFGEAATMLIFTPLVFGISMGCDMEH